MRISDWSSDVCSSDLPAGTIAKIITVATQKGGAGKTTTSMNVAADFARRGYRALVVSADKQGSAVAWAAAASEGKPFPARVINLAAAGKTLNREPEKRTERRRVGTECVST